jgi:hypothetical protein
MRVYSFNKVFIMINTSSIDRHRRTKLGREINRTVRFNFRAYFHERKTFLGVLAIVLCLMAAIIASGKASAFSLPDTGQTKCYEEVSPFKAAIPCAGTGQDGDHIINPMSYTDNGNGTVTDNNTGLMWQKCSVGQNNDATCSGTASALNWYQASGTYDATYNPSGSGVCGNWRLPTGKELITIVDYSIPGGNANINSTYFPNTIGDSYWLSATFGGNSDMGWFVSFYNGNSSARLKSDSSYVRCVLGAPDAQSFTDNQDGTETDNKTRLIWQKCSAGQSYDGSCSGNASIYDNWNDALDYCNNLSLASQMDWRLPNIKELDTLMELDPAIFPESNAAAYWSSTTYAGVFNTLWGYALCGAPNGIAFKQVKPEGYMTSARCVRGFSLNLCPSTPAQIKGKTPYYQSIQSAYAQGQAADGDTIQMQALGNCYFKGNINLNRDIKVNLKGGYGCSFISNPGFTILNGSLTISGGTVTIEELIISAHLCAD